MVSLTRVSLNVRHWLLDGPAEARVEEIELSPSIQTDGNNSRRCVQPLLPPTTDSSLTDVYGPDGCLHHSSRPVVRAARILVTKEICSDAEPLPTSRGRRKSSAAV